MLPYNTVIDPISGNQYSLQSREGIRILKKYVLQFQQLGGFNWNVIRPNEFENNTNYVKQFPVSNPIVFLHNWRRQAHRNLDSSTKIKDKNLLLRSKNDTLNFGQLYGAVKLELNQNQTQTVLLVRVPFKIRIHSTTKQMYVQSLFHAVHVENTNKLLQQIQPLVQNQGLVDLNPVVNLTFYYYAFELNTDNNTKLTDQNTDNNDVQKKEVNEYLQSLRLVVTKSTADNSKETVMESLSKHPFFQNKSTKIDTIQQKVREECNYHRVYSNKTWAVCALQREPCKIIKQYANEELSSTAYMLRVFANCATEINDENEIQIGISSENIKNLSGYFGTAPDFTDGDGQYFFVVENEKQSSQKLILALGPSASGKTFIGKKVCTIVNKIFNASNNNGPYHFFTLDGAKFRECSNTYQAVIEEVKKDTCKDKNIVGFSNLTSVNVFLKILHDRLYNGSKQKKNLTNWLNLPKHRGRLSLYVPLTMAEPNVLLSSLLSKIKKFIQITGDKMWCGCLIWQHLYKNMARADAPVGKWKRRCDQCQDLQCEGTVKLGSFRASTEGKQYDSSGWLSSMNNGERLMMAAPGLRLEIHNSGSKDRRSILTEYPIDDKHKLNSTLFLGDSLGVFCTETESKIMQQCSCQL